MKAVKLYNYTSSVFSVAIAFFLVFSLGSCARKIVFQTSPIVPAAQGFVKVKKDKNNNYALEIDVRNLADPKRLDPPKQTYVVWTETERDGTKNIGQMNSSSGFLSSKLKASLTAVTPFKPTSVFITAEDNADIRYPGMQVVLRTRNF